MAGADRAVGSTTQGAVPGFPTLPAACVPWTLTMCVPSPRPETAQPVACEQETGARSSRVQRNDVASPSIQVMCAAVGLVGVTVTVGELGAVVSTVHETVPAV